MIIRSQDRRGFVNLENVDTVCISSEWEVFAFNNNAKSYLGTYSTEEKAIKVLDMICEKYSSCEWTDVECSICHKTVFQMPQDSEV